MKKFVLLILVGLLVTLALAACGKSYCKHDDPSQIVTVKTVSPTCQRTGLTAGKKCNICETYVIPQEILPVRDCIESDWIVDKEPTKTEDGLKHTECTMCGKLFQEVTIYAGSQGLNFVLNSDGQSYSVKGIGTCTDSDVVIPRQYKGLPVTMIANYAFRECTSLTSVTIGDSVTSIGDYAFSGCASLTSVEVDPNNAYYKSVDGVLYTKDGKTLLFYPRGKTNTIFITPNFVTIIADDAFSKCTSLTSVTIGDSVISIGAFAFEECHSLTSVTIGNSVTSIDHHAFFYCSSLENVTIGNSVTSIGYGSFSGCTSLTSINIPDSVTEISSLAFASCTSLTSINIPDSVTSIGEFAFGGCKSLTLYCEAIFAPSGWIYYWDNLHSDAKIPVVWGYKAN